MLEKHFSFRSRIEAPVDQVFAWHKRPGAFELLTPPWEPVKVEERYGDIHDGGCVVFTTKFGPIDQRWVIRHQDYIENRQFRDVQLSGPFQKWDHTHLFEPDGDNACFIEDQINYALPGGSLGEMVGGGFTQAKLQRVFSYRHQIIAQTLALLGRYPTTEPLKVLISGSTGLVGSALAPLLTTGGHSVTRLVRSRPKAGENAVEWSPGSCQLDPAAIEGFDAVIHLAGESIAGRWSEEKKRRIRDSRIQGTRLLSETLARLERPPRVLISASAIGFYGNGGDQALSEESRQGNGFLAEVCREWEAATEAARSRGVRVVFMRFGIILSPKGGALALMLPAFQVAMGGQLGSGEQYMSWIALDDVVGAIYHTLWSESLSGPVNTVAPQTLRNRDFTETLGRVLGRPTILSVPTVLLHTAMGEMADEMLLTSCRAEPRRLLESGYQFLYPDLTLALRHLLGRTNGE